MKPETVRRRSPLSWVPTVYFAMGLPFILVNMVSTLMFRGLGIDDARRAWTHAYHPAGCSNRSGAP